MGEKEKKRKEKQLQRDAMKGVGSTPEAAAVGLGRLVLSLRSSFIAVTPSSDLMAEGSRQRMARVADWPAADI